MVLFIIFLEDKRKIVLHLSIFYEYQQAALVYPCTVVTGSYRYSIQTKHIGIM
jgi:hypothetical protein